MEPQEAIVRFVVGGALITFISFLGETKYRLLSGLFVLFPIVTVVGYYFLAQTMSMPELRSTVLFSVLALPTVLAFLLGFYLATAKYSVPVSLAVGIAVWLLVALFIVLTNEWYVGLGGGAA